MSENQPVQPINERIKTFLSESQAVLRKWLPSRGSILFTLISIGLLILVQSAGAFKETSSVYSEPTGSTGLIAYQGRLADIEGKPLTGIFTMVFRLYNQSSSGLPLWEEQRTGPNSVVISDGLFNVMLGSLTPIPQSLVTSNADLFLGITVGNDDEMVPRVQIGSVMYARQALTVPDGSITAEKLADGAVPPGVPIGTVISWWRPNADTPLPSDEWMIADGSLISDPSSPLNGTNLPNLTNRFVMGTTAEQIGITGGSNILNLAHQHQVDSHTHTIPSHAHSGAGLYAYLALEDDRAYVKEYGPGFAATNANYTGSSHLNTHITDASAGVGGSTASWSGASGTSAPYTSQNLSATTDNRPQYVGLIYLVRIK